MNQVDYAVVGVLAIEGEASIAEIASMLELTKNEAIDAVTRLTVRGHLRMRCPIGDPPMYELAPSEVRR